jgi:Spy/CpxP family protein refolding chaperone
MTRFTSRNARGLMMALTTGVALTFAGASVLAQPGGHGHRGGGGIDQMIGHMIAQAKDRLNLNSSQQVIFDNAVAQSKSAHEAARSNRQQVKAALNAELAKSEPDLASVATLSDSIEQQNRSLRNNVRSEWLRLYATFTPEQKAVARDMLQKKVERAESFGKHMRERFHQQQQPNG